MIPLYVFVLVLLFVVSLWCIHVGVLKDRHQIELREAEERHAETVLHVYFGSRTVLRVSLGTLRHCGSLTTIVFGTLIGLAARGNRGGP